MTSKSVRKAIIALVGAAIAAVATALQTGDVDRVDDGEWLYIAGTVLGTGALTYIATNVTGVLGGAIKALVAGGGTAVASLTAAYQADSMLSTSEYLIAVSAAITVLVGTYEVADEPLPST